MASLAVSPSHMQTTQSFSTEVRPATWERKEKGESSKTTTDTANVRRGVITMGSYKFNLRRDAV